ncbi:MAG TPA: DUF488 family protein [Clostridia bacterium]|nr:DUF488 family protein [Clostridia bacterium]
MAASNTQPTYKRQRFLLAFIRQLKSGVTSTDLQKLVFMYTMKEKSEFYQFVPYKFGSYSFQLAEDIDILRRDGYLSTEVSRIQAIGDYPHEANFSISNERGDNLIRKAYRKYPFYAINSEITNRLFIGDEFDSFKHERQRYVQPNQVLFTIGYEGKSIEEFINILIVNDIRLLCDVRKNALSRKFGFSKSKLKHITETVGIKYIHIPDLGIESNKRSSLETTVDYQLLFKDYKKALPNYKQQLEYLYSLLSSNVRIALMCYEKEANMCHRHVIRDSLTDTNSIRSVDI